MLFLPALVTGALLSWSATPAAASTRPALSDRLAYSALVEARAVEVSLPVEALARRTLEKRAVCTVPSQCSSPMPPHAHKICRDALCRTVCDTGYYFDSSSLCQLYTCVVSSCPTSIPANSKRICTSKNLCSFACLAGYQLSGSGTTCVLKTSLSTTPSAPAPTAPAFVRVAGFSQSSLASNGLKMTYGTIRSTLLWQSSGILAFGSCLNTRVSLSTCWRLSLDATGNLQDSTLAPTSSTATSQKNVSPSSQTDTLSDAPDLSLQEQSARDDENLELYHRAFPGHQSALVKRRDCDIPGNGTTTSPRQRIEFLSWPGAAAGTSWKYTWSTYLTPNVGSTSRFFHLWQIFSRDPCVPGPIVMMGPYLGNIVITDPRRRFCGGTTGVACPSIPMSSFWGRTVVHTLSITYGEFGRISYNVVEKGKPAVSLLRFNAVGEMGGAASLKLGMYRAAEGVPTGAETFLAGYTAVRVT